MSFWIFLLSCIYMILPAGMANMFPVFFVKLKSFRQPVDFGLRFRGKRVLGDHKTIRGYVVGILAAILTVHIQARLALDISIIDYSSQNLYLLGFLLGFGALFGDSVKSFFKRQLGIRPGSSFFPWDQLDFIIGALAFLSIVYPVTWQQALTLVIAMPLLHIVIRHIGYWLGITDSRW